MLEDGEWEAVDTGEEGGYMYGFGQKGDDTDGGEAYACFRVCIDWKYGWSLSRYV